MPMTLDSPVAQALTPIAANRDFPTPRPNRLLMWALGFINRWFIVRGLPILRHIPGLRDLPGGRGYLRIRLDLPDADRARLAAAVNPGTAAFLGPNHPEFGADWMIDKELSTRIAPTMASWAAHEIVGSAPAFWLANNLVSNKGGDAAMEYSIQWARAGKGVLLHPEGTVRWTSDKVHPLFSGIAEMAVETAQRIARDGGSRPVYIVPLVWKLRYLHDVSAAMHRDMRRIERALGLPRGEGRDLIGRFHALQENILALQAERFGWSASVVVSSGHAVIPSASSVIPSEASDLHSRTTDFFDRQDAFRLWLVNDLETRYPVEPIDSIDRRVRRLERAIRAERSRLREAGEPRDSARSIQLRDDADRVDEALRLGGFSRDVYFTPLLSQEQIAESLKRIRAALVRGGTKNTIHNYLPRPYGSRVAHVRAPEPIEIDPRRASAGGPERDAYVHELLDRARLAMQNAIDTVNAEHAREIAAFSHPNPFVVRS